MTEHLRLVGIIRKLADCLEGATDADVNDLIAGRAALQILPRRSRGGTGSAGPHKEDPLIDWSVVISQLRTLTSREDGESLISRFADTKARLEGLSRALDLPVAKHDTADHLRQRIIASTIGSMLGSRAIRGDGSPNKDAETPASTGHPPAVPILKRDPRNRPQ